jgi:hypothetical protein
MICLVPQVDDEVGRYTVFVRLDILTFGQGSKFREDIFADYSQGLLREAEHASRRTILLAVAILFDNMIGCPWSSWCIVSPIESGDSAFPRSEHVGLATYLLREISLRYS